MRSNIILWGFIFLSMFSVIVTILKSMELTDQLEAHASSKEKIGSVPIRAMSINPERLSHEAMFTRTLKECIPHAEATPNGKKKKECKTFVPEGSIERIAVMGPPGKMDSSLLKFIETVLSKGKKGPNGEIAATQVQVIPISNIAPYGYGKTHGYTRIVRIVPEPLLLGATNTLKATIASPPPPVSVNPLTLNDLKAALRQQVRYHCRLNHVAAHTAMWTIGVEEFAETKIPQLVERAQLFFGLDGKQDDLIHKVTSEYESLDDRSTALHKMVSEGSILMSHLGTKNATNSILKILDDVLLDEMRISKNLTAWPCESFWTVGEPGNRLEISPLIRYISKRLSPNCSAPYTSCFVQKDKCEAKGDGECK